MLYSAFHFPPGVRRAVLARLNWQQLQNPIDVIRSQNSKGLTNDTLAGRSQLLKCPVTNVVPAVG